MTHSSFAASLSIIIPVLNEADRLSVALDGLHQLKENAHADVELIVVDGGSHDESLTRAKAYADQIIKAPRGRGAQMNAGADIARHDILLFLHADTHLPPNALTLILEAIQRGAIWGRFDVRITASHPKNAAGLRMVAGMMNWRSRLTGIATGDQAIFVTRAAFHHHGPFAEIALMEDIVLSQRLRAVARPCCLRAKVTTSGRRWEQQGMLRTILLMWRLRLQFFFGANPNHLARQYGYLPPETSTQ